MSYQPALMRPLSEMDDATIFGLHSEVSREATFRRMRKERWWETWNMGRICAGTADHRTVFIALRL